MNADSIESVRRAIQLCREEAVKLNNTEYARRVYQDDADRTEKWLTKMLEQLENDSLTPEANTS